MSKLKYVFVAYDEEEGEILRRDYLFTSERSTGNILDNFVVDAEAYQKSNQ